MNRQALADSAKGSIGEGAILKLLGMALRSLLALALAIASAGAPGQDAADRKPLRFIGNASLPPVVFSDRGQARGVAVDLVMAAAREAGLDIRIEAMNWQQAQTEMREGRADGLIHINPTPERLQSLAFSAPLLESRFHIFRRSDRSDIQDMASLAGRRVGVERAGFPAQYLANHPQAQIEFVPSWKDAFERLGRGELDAVFVDRWAGDYALSQLGGSNIVAVEPPVVEDRSSVAVARTRPELLAALDRGLAAIDGNGTRQAILQRWSGQEVVRLTRQTLERDIIAAVAVVAAIGGLLTLAYVVRLRRLNRALAGSRDAQAQALGEAMQANARLRELSAEQAAIVEGEVVGIFKVRNRAFVWANRAFADMFGHAVDELTGQSTRRLFESDEAFIGFGARLGRALQAHGRFREDMRLVRKDGSTGWYSLSVAMLDPDSQVMLAAVVDVTAQRNASAALQEAFAELTALYNDSPIGLHSLAPDGTVLRINDTELRWLGLERDAVVGRLNYVDLLTPQSRAIFQESFPKFQRTGVVQDLRLDLSAADGTALPVMVNAKAVVDGNGQLVMSRSTVQNLTQQQSAQAQMEQAQRIAHVGSWEIDLVDGAIEWSREMRKLFDMPPDAPLGVEAIVQVVHPDDRGWLEERYRHSCEQGEPMHVRCRVVGRDGAIRHLEMIGECRRGAGGAIVGMVGTAQDVTAEVRSAQEMERSEQRYRTVVDSQSEMIHRLRADGTLLLANPQFCKVFGVEADAVVGQVWKLRAHPDDVAMVESRLGELSPLHPVVVIENRVPTASRGMRWMEFFHQGFFDEQGRLVELQCVGRDVHDRKLLEDQLAQELQVRQAMLDNDLVGILTAKDRVITWANPAFERLMGYGPGELVGLPVRTGYPSDAVFESFGARAYALLQQGKRFSQRTEFVRKDGGQVWADVSGAPLNEPGLSLWVFIDVTARQLAEEELQRHRENLEALVEERTAKLTAALELAEAANRAKGVFLATMSHELRTPMNAILGLSYIVRNRVPDPRIQDQLSKIEDAGRQLLSLIDDLLDVTRIEADRLSIVAQPMRLADILTRVDVALGARAAQGGLQLRVESSAELLTRELTGDPLRLQQILTNLVGNAIKFTEQGSIRICLSASPAPDDRTLLRVEVIDTGVGIAAEDQVRIFSLFEQVDATMTRRYGGAGLGLALCKKLVELMGGRIGVDSSPGHGSCFWFEVTLGGPAASLATASEVDDAKGQLRSSFAGARVLVVDDDSINAEVAQLMLEEVRLEVDLAHDGQAAIEQVAARRYALVLMDLQMPGMDGLAATRAIRSIPNGKDTPIVALTARVVDLDSGECAAAGIDEVITKPAVTSVFYRRILDVLKKAAPAAA